MNAQTVDLANLESRKFEGATHLRQLLLVLPLRAIKYNDHVYVDSQARNGLRLWLQNFDRVTLAAPTINSSPSRGYLPIDDPRISFAPMPIAYTPFAFARTLASSVATLDNLIDQATDLQFAIGGLFGDWASVSALLAYRKRRPFAVWTDRVESQVQRFQAGSKSGPKKQYYMMVAWLMKHYERFLIRRGPLGLFHGMDCYTAYAPFCQNPHLVHDVHLDKESQITDAELKLRLSYRGPMRIAYAGRVHRDKGVYDWIEVLNKTKAAGITFLATWYGDGPELESARSVVQHVGMADCVNFAGPIAHREMIDKIKLQHDVFLFCHKTLESPRCLIESLICGVPIVGYASHYAHDLIRENRGGVLTPQDEISKLAGALASFGENRETLTIAASLDGKQFDDASVFRHRSELIKSIRTI